MVVVVTVVVVVTQTYVCVQVQVQVQVHAKIPICLTDVLRETLRVWPLFGIAHRITSDDIEIPTPAGAGTTTTKTKTKTTTIIPKGSVLCFNYPKYHSSGFDDASKFIPERWAHARERDSNYSPFGAARNRPCPGKRLSLVWCVAVLISLSL
jgi:cytochrome P450